MSFDLMQAGQSGDYSNLYHIVNLVAPFGHSLAAASSMIDVYLPSVSTNMLGLPGIALRMLREGNVEANIFHHNAAISTCCLVRYKFQLLLCKLSGCPIWRYITLNGYN